MVVAATFGSASWAGGNDKAKGNAFGPPGNGDPKYQWTPAAEPVAKNSQRAAEASVDKNSNGVLEQPDNPNNVCNNLVSAQPGRNPHCPLNP